MKNFFRLLILVVLPFFVACKNDVEDAIDVAEGVDRQSIDRSLLSINAFGNDGRYGTAAQQFSIIRDRLGLNRLRIVIDWNDGHQPSSNQSYNFAFADSVVNSIPDGMSAIVVLNQVPRWMSDTSTWVNGSAIDSFVERFVDRVVRRYGGNPKIEGFQVWNEPNMIIDRYDNDIMNFGQNAYLYVELLSKAYTKIKSIAPGKLVISAATTSINQNFPETLDYNRNMVSAGALNYCDVYAIHFYGRQYERVLFDGGVRNFVNGLNKVVYVTETGAQADQLAYGEEVWPFLKEQMPAIERMYIYKYDEDSGYGLVSPSGVPTDLYNWLEDSK